MKITETTKGEKKDGLGLARGALLLLFTFQVSSFSLCFADIHYVDIASTNPVAPYTNWATAATVIQDAVDEAATNDTVRVADGVYATGGLDNYPGGSTLTNRVVIPRAMKVQSVNGPQSTFIVGKGVGDGGTNCGDGAVRCVYLASGALLDGFTLTNGYTLLLGALPEMDDAGGGVWCESTNAVVSNCVLICNSADTCGGGAYNGALYSCRLEKNLTSFWWGGAGAFGSFLYNCFLSENVSGADGGAVYWGELHSCTLVGNRAYNGGGGASDSCLYNCIVYYNEAAYSPNWQNIIYAMTCCSEPRLSGFANITNAPQIVGLGDPHVLGSSPCLNAGFYESWMAVKPDIDGESRTNGTVDIGADEYWPAGRTGSLSVAIGEYPTQGMAGCALAFAAAVTGRVQGYVWTFGDGQAVTGLFAVSHAYADTGNYSVVLAASNLGATASATVTVHVVEAPDLYVSPGGNDGWPGTNWATAKATLQAAVEAAAPHKTVWVTNGTYGTGGKVVYGAMTNRVAVDKPITLRSVNGPSVTFIQGKGPKGAGAIRCAYLADGASLVGFTLTNGHTCTSGDTVNEQSGGGALCASSNSVVSNCTFLCNSAAQGGGGMRGGSVLGSRLAFNSAAQGGAAYSATLRDCTVNSNSASGDGGGVYSGTVYRSELSTNSAYNSGGGAYAATLYNCVVMGNACAMSQGGGAYGGTLYGCSVIGNSAATGGGVSGGAVLRDCIVAHNSAPSGTNWTGNCGFTTTCTTPLPAGTGNIAEDPRIAGIRNPHLLSSSPCLNLCTTETWMVGAVDMDGEPRTNGLAEMGADEYWGSGLSGSLSVSISVTETQSLPNVPITFLGAVEGRAQGLVWNFGDGQSATDVCVVSHTFVNPGSYEVVLTAFNLSGSEAATVTVSFTEGQCVSPFGNDAWAGTNWATAKATLQAAVDAAIPNGIVWVTNGTYSTGGKVVYGSMMNRVAIDKPVAVRSVNGPDVTFIEGLGVGGGGTNNGEGAVRCAYVASNAWLIGFTLTNGHTRATGDSDREQSGGGVWCETGGTVSNCVLVGNSANYRGGGSCNGSLMNCRIRNNGAMEGGGCYDGRITDCVISSNSAVMGGGLFLRQGHCANCRIIANTAGDIGGGVGIDSWGSCDLADNCEISFNHAAFMGGGVSDMGGMMMGGFRNCFIMSNSADIGGGVLGCMVEGGIIMGNSSTMEGGGAAYAWVNNGTIVGNTGEMGGGVGFCEIRNSIVYSNYSSSSETNWAGSSFENSCTIPLPPGSNNIAVDPQFEALAVGNYRLKLTSPCIDRGANLAWMFGAEDMDGNERIINGKADMGAYETPFAASLRAWLQGAYNTNQDRMTTGLMTHIPLISPYKADPRSVSSVPSNVTDWVLVQLRETNGNAIMSRSAFVNRDGYVLADNGSTGVVVDVSQGTNCYLVLQHRNHLAVMTAQPLAFTNILTTWDFTTNWNAYYGGSNAAVEVEPGAWGMAAGDADGDGKITETDRKIVEQQKGRSGYLPGDLDLNGVVE